MFCRLSEGSAAKTRPLRPREKFAQHGAHFSLTRLSEGAAAKIRLLRPRRPFARDSAHVRLTPDYQRGSMRFQLRSTCFLISSASSRLR